MSATTDLPAVTTGSLVALLRFADSDSDYAYPLLLRGLMSEGVEVRVRERLQIRFGPDDEDGAEAKILDEGADEARLAAAAKSAYFRRHLEAALISPVLLPYLSSTPFGAGASGSLQAVNHVTVPRTESARNPFIAAVCCAIVGMCVAR